MSFRGKDIKITILCLIVFLLSCAPKRHAEMGKVHFIDNRKTLNWELSKLSAAAYEFVVKGSLFEQRGMIPEAVYSYKRAVDENDRSPFLRTRLAMVLLKQGEIEGAELQVNRAISIDDKYLDAYSILGKIFIIKSDFKQAIENFEKIIELDNKKEDANLDLCNVYLEQKKYDTAVKTLGKLIKVNPSNALAYYYLGRTYSEINKLDRAKHNYKKVIEIKPLFVSAYKAVGLIEEFQGNYKEAVRYFKKALDLEIGNDNLRGHIAQIYIELEDYIAAFTELKVLSENNPENVSLKIKMGLVLLKLSRLKEAISLFNTVLKKQPESERVRYYLAGTYFQKKKYDLAMEHFSKISAQSELYPDSRLNIAFILNRKGETDRAKEVLRKAILMWPKSAELYITLATFYETDKKLDDSERVLKQALKEIPNNEEVYLRLGNIYDKQGKKEDGLKLVNKVLEINPENPSALNYIAYTYAENNEKLDEALTLVSNALKLKPGDGYIMDTMGWIYFKRGDYKKSLKVLNEALKIVESEPVIFEHLGDVYNKLGNRNGALKMYQKAVELFEEDKDIERIKNKLRKFVNEKKQR